MTPGEEAAVEELSTAEEIRRAVSDPEGSVVLLDSGGFVWWTDVDRRGDVLLHGVGIPARAGARGLAVEAYLNIMSPEEAVPYGPFRVVRVHASR